MGLGKLLTDGERSTIVTLLAQGKSKKEIANELGRSERTITRYLANPSHRYSRPKGSYKNSVTEREKRSLKRAMSKNPLGTSREIFQEAGVKERARSTRCAVLATVGKVRKAIAKPPLTKAHRDRRLAWASENMKTEFKYVIWTDEARVSLDGPDGWARGWIADGSPIPSRNKRQQGGGGLMIWVGMVDGRVIGPVRMKPGVKLNSEKYTELLEDSLFSWLKKEPLSQRRKYILQQDNAPSHVSKYTLSFLDKKGFKEHRRLPWPSNSPDLNPVENYWSILKRKIYANNKQFDDLESLWSAVKTAAGAISVDEADYPSGSYFERIDNKYCVQTSWMNQPGSLPDVVLSIWSDGHQHQSDRMNTISSTPHEYRIKS
ncbi:hypothetical protein FOL47_011357, partial [Perkinsus chesapeaki]